MNARGFPTGVSRWCPTTGYSSTNVSYSSPLISRSTSRLLDLDLDDPPLPYGSTLIRRVVPDHSLTARTVPVTGEGARSRFSGFQLAEVSPARNFRPRTARRRGSPQLLLPVVGNADADVGPISRTQT